MVRNTVRKMVARTLLALIAGLALSSAAAAETLMMPKRDAKKGVPVVVWGITTQANGTAYSIDYGDGVVQSGSVSDRSYIAFNHTYANAGNYTATLTVGGEQATVALQVFDPVLLTAENLRSLGINMAIEDGLRWLWVNQNNRGDLANALTSFGGGFTPAYTSLVTLAFENHGYKVPNGNAAPTGLYEKYIVRRSLNYIVATLAQTTVGVQTHTRPDPANGSVLTTFNDDPCIGVPSDAQKCLVYYQPSDSAYSTAVAMLAFAGSGALNRVNTEVNNFALNKTYGEILQRMVNAQTWGQNDSGNARGGWWYGLNQQGQGDGSTLGWAILSLLDAEAAGAAVPGWVKEELKYQVGGQIGTVNIVGAAVNANGGLDYCADGNPNGNCSAGIEKGGIPLQGYFLTGQTSTAPGSKAALTIKYLSDRWNGYPGETWGCGMNYGAGHDYVRGCSYALFNAFKGLKLMGVQTLPGSTRPAGPGAIPAGDWYAEFQDHLVAKQQSPNNPGGGFFPAQFSCCEGNGTIIQAIAELVLSPVALVLPDEEKFSTVGLSPATHSAIEGGTHTVTAKAESTGGTPVGGATVVFTILTGPNAGLTGTDVTDVNGEATFTYTDGGPDGTTGVDRIQAKIGNLESNIVKMTWLPKNTPPVANDDAFSTPEDTMLNDSVAGNDTDADGDTLTFTLVGGTANGALVFNADGTFSYTPGPNFNGSDSFTYKVNDGKVDGNTATVTITVTPVNDPPVAGDDSASTNEDTPVSGNVLPNDSDIDGDMLTVSLVSGPSSGIVALAPNGTFTYTPALNFNGTVTFTYVANDGSANSNVATVTIVVRPVNDNPVCSVAPSVSLLWPPNHKLVPVSLSGATDVDGDTLTTKVTLITQDEPTNTQGDGNTSSDAAGIGTSVAQLRAERSGTPKTPGDGRVYHVNYTVTDGNGGSCSGVVTVGVPHDQGQRSVPVDNGPRFNSVTGAAL